MSATLNAELFSNYYGGAPTFRIPVRLSYIFFVLTVELKSFRMLEAHVYAIKCLTFKLLYARREGMVVIGWMTVHEVCVSKFVLDL